MGRGKYLQLSNGDYIRPIGEDITAAAQFEVEVGAPVDARWPGAHFIHLKAANGKYWGITKRNNRDYIGASFDTPEEATRLIVLNAY